LNAIGAFQSAICDLQSAIGKSVRKKWGLAPAIPRETRVESIAGRCLSPFLPNAPRVPGPEAEQTMTEPELVNKDAAVPAAEAPANGPNGPPAPMEAAEIPVAAVAPAGAIPMALDSPTEILSDKVVPAAAPPVDVVSPPSSVPGVAPP